MAIDPKKLAAFAKQSPKGGGKGGPPPTDSDYDDSSLDEQQEEVEEDNEEGGEDNEDNEEGEEDFQEGGEGRFGELIPLLEEYADDLNACVEELDPATFDFDDLEDVPEDEAMILKEGYNALEGRLKAACKKAFSGGITRDEGVELAEHLVDESMVDDPERLGGWFTLVSML